MRKLLVILILHVNRDGFCFGIVWLSSENDTLSGVNSSLWLLDKRSYRAFFYLLDLFCP